MSANSLLDSLCELQVLVLSPSGEASDALALQLIRTGCPVHQYWPPPEAFDVPVDVVFTSISQNRHHGEIAALLAIGTPCATLVVLVKYESSAVLSQIIELRYRGVITQLLDTHRVLPVLVSARRISEEMMKLKQKIEQFRECIAGQARINQAKALLTRRHGWDEREAHRYLSRKAVKRREPILKIVRELPGGEPPARAILVCFLATGWDMSMSERPSEHLPWVVAILSKLFDSVWEWIVLCRCSGRT